MLKLILRLKSKIKKEPLKALILSRHFVMPQTVDKKENASRYGII